MGCFSIFKSCFKFSSPRDSSFLLSPQNQTYGSIGITKMPLEKRVLNNEKAELRLCQTSTLLVVGYNR